MTTAIAPATKKTPSQIDRRAVTRDYVCGFHLAKNPDHCRGAVRNSRLGVLVCSAYTGPERCLDCGSTEGVHEWTCTDPHECAATIRAKQRGNALHQQLLTIRASQVNRTTRMDSETRAILRQVREAAQNGELFTDANGEEIVAGHWLLEDSFDAPEEERPRKSAKAKKGSCRCCGEETRGGKFLPGHDAKLKSALKATLKSGSDEEKAAAWERVVAEGWDELDGWPAR